MIGACIIHCLTTLHTESGRMLYDVPSMAVCGEAVAVSVEMESTRVPRVTVSQKCLHALNMPVSTHTYTRVQRAARVAAACSTTPPEAPAPLPPAARLPPSRPPPVPCGKSSCAGLRR